MKDNFTIEWSVFVQGVDSENELKQEKKYAKLLLMPRRIFIQKTPESVWLLSFRKLGGKR